MRWFLDTEFDENGVVIRLISIALVSERGDEYYRRLADGWRPDDCNDWVKANVLPHLPPADGPLCVPRAQVADDLRTILLAGVETPEIWADFGSYDWVALCQLFGTMVDLPTGMPMFICDLQQELLRLGLSNDELPKHVGDAHDALEDARWLRSVWMCLPTLAVPR